VLLVLLAGLVFRLTLFPLAPNVSPDVHRYLWEGLVQQAGLSPYRLPPSDAALDELAAQYPRHAANVRQPSTHQDIASIYPPVPQLLFRFNAAIFDGALVGWKLILLLFDGLLAGALLYWLVRRGVSGGWLAAVWWCPLLLIESYEGAHLDLVGTALLTTALIFAVERRWIAAGLLLGLAANVKYLWPLLLAALLFGRSLPGWGAVRFALAVAFAGVVVWLPYWDDLPAALATARMFAERWTFNDIVFEAVRLIPGPAFLPPLLVALVLAVLAALLIWRKGGELWRDAWLLGGAGLLLSPVAYPWYFIWILPGLAWRPPLWLVIWIVSVPLLHSVHWHYVATGSWNPMVPLWYIVTVPPALLLARAWWQRLRTPASLSACSDASEEAAD
jgi:hypothetical protein